MGGNLLLHRLFEVECPAIFPGSPSRRSSGLGWTMCPSRYECTVAWQQRGISGISDIALPRVVVVQFLHFPADGLEDHVFTDLRSKVIGLRKDGTGTREHACSLQRWNGSRRWPWTWSDWDIDSPLADWMQFWGCYVRQDCRGTLLTFGGLHSVQKEQKDRAANLKTGFGGTFWSPCLQTVANIRMLFVEVAWCNQFTRWWLFSRFDFHPPFEQRTALTLNCTSHHTDVDTFHGFVVSCTSLTGSQTDMAKDDRLIMFNRYYSAANKASCVFARFLMGSTNGKAWEKYFGRSPSRATACCSDLCSNFPSTFRNQVGSSQSN